MTAALFVSTCAANHIIGNMANRYAEMRNASGRVHDRALFLQPRSLGELELQARWFAGDFGTAFVSTTGAKIDIIQFGTWNREAGPDFRDAAISIDGGKPVAGCIEIDLLDRSWESHGHAINPAFDETVLHVFVNTGDREFFTRTRLNRNVPQVRIDPAVLPDAFRAEVALAKPGRCQGPLKNMADQQVQSILDAAGKFRLQRKATALRHKILNHGCEEAVFREVAAALGYKENKLGFALTAQRTGLKFLRAQMSDAEALLFGIAGFLNESDLDDYRRSSRTYVRELWDRWWPHRDAMTRLVLPPKTWKISSTRPVNHPQRRLAALAVLAQAWPAFRRALDKHESRSIRKFLGTLEHPFWNTHYTLTAAPSPKTIALVGESRIADILANIVFPFWLAEQSRPNESWSVDLWSEYSRLPAQLTNRRVETGGLRLFGDDPRRGSSLKTLAHQQGLLQIYEDFCLQDNSDCTQCPFPEQMRNWG